MSQNPCSLILNHKARESKSTTGIVVNLQETRESTINQISEDDDDDDDDDDERSINIGNNSSIINTTPTTAPQYLARERRRGRRRRKNKKQKKMIRSEVEVSPIEIMDLEEEDDDHGDHRYKTISSNNAISVDEQYYYCDDEDQEDKDLQLTIMASLLQTRQRREEADDDDDDDGVQVLEIKPPTSTSTRLSRKRKPFTGQSSSNSEIDTLLTFTCEICIGPKPYGHLFIINGCTHSYCSDCIIKYVASKLQENIVQIRCPESKCRGLLEPEDCRGILPPEVFDRWGAALCEAVILSSEKFYCAYEDCSALLIDDDGGEVISQLECPNCRRSLCVKCKVPWHSGVDCAEFQKLNKDERGRDDLKVMELAKKQRWKRCPKCKFYVQRSTGCDHMKCRCGNQFCYKCGSSYFKHDFSKCKR